MSAIIAKARRPRKDALYGREELQVINKYKEEYRQQTTRELRANVFKTKILVDLFNFWLDQGRAPATEEDSVNRMKVSLIKINTMPYWFLICLSFRKELAAWVRNNWRPYSTTIETKPNIKISAINVVWQTQKAVVEEKIKEILGVEELDTRNPGYFQQRMAAAKRVLDEMTEQERTAINQIVEERKAQGNPEHIRRE